MTDPIITIQYRGGEIENLLRVRDKFVELLEKYSQGSNSLPRSKMLGPVFDTIFHIGICNMREHLPSMKEIYLDVGESRNASLRHLSLLEELKIIERVSSAEDSRVRQVKLT